MKKRAFLVPVAAAVAGLLGSQAVTPKAAAAEPTDTPDPGAVLPGTIAETTVDPTAPRQFTVASPAGRLDAFVLQKGPGELLYVDHHSHHSHHSHKSHHSHTSGT
jgi:hypothetical protein